MASSFGLHFCIFRVIFSDFRNGPDTKAEGLMHSSGLWRVFVSTVAMPDRIASVGTEFFLSSHWKSRERMTAKFEINGNMGANFYMCVCCYSGLSK